MTDKPKHKNKRHIWKAISNGVDKVLTAIPKIPGINLIAKAWNKIPTTHEMIVKNRKKYKNQTTADIMFGISVAIYLIIMGGASYLMNWSYTAAKMGAAISLIFSVMFFVWISHELHFGDRFKDRITTAISLFFGIFILVIGIISMTPHLEENVNPNTSIQPNTTYLTYSPKCEYCQAAHDATADANAIYDSTHFKDLKVVNLDKDTRLARQLKNIVPHTGSIVHIDKNGNPDAPMTYTTGTDKGPTKPTANYVYWVMVHGDK